MHLNHTDTPFDIKDSNHVQDGQIRDSGVYVQDNGEVGTLQQVDLSV